MCGIAGIWDFEEKIDCHELDNFTDSLAHRGPDGRGVFIDRGLGLGHRRLAILDLSPAGQCPMLYTGPDGNSYWITFNGEVYDYLELRQELIAKGHKFQSHTDTEVVVAAFAEWRQDCLLRFNGMWAFAIWDVSRHELFLSRDRFGVKPLYYRAGKRFAFASELKAFSHLRDFHAALDMQSARHVLEHAQRYEGMTDGTLYQGVRRLQGGCWLKIKADGSSKMGRWWNTREHLPVISGSYSDQVEIFRATFLDAVRLRLRSDVPVGTCLSGGIDSSCVASAIASHRATGSRRSGEYMGSWKSFIATFPGTAIDESRYADSVADSVGCEAVHWVFEGKRSLSFLEDCVWSMEEVYPGIAVPVWGLYRRMREAGVPVSIDGHGADELLGGYPWYLDWPRNRLNANLFQEFHASLLPSILRNFDRCSMAHGVEVRMPFMDWRVVCLAFALPPEAKIGGGYTKRILRDAFRGTLPPEVIGRRGKIGFNSPMIEWFNGDLRVFLDRITQHPFWIENELFNGKSLGAAVRAKCQARAWQPSDWDATLQIWTCANLVLWQILFVEGRRGMLKDWGF